MFLIGTGVTNSETESTWFTNLEIQGYPPTVGIQRQNHWMSKLSLGAHTCNLH